MGVLFKEGREYSVAVTLDNIRHIADDKKLSREEIIDYLDRLADTILEYDSVHFDYYIKGNNKIPGLLFKKQFEDGVLISFDLISNKKRSISLHTLYLDSASYQKKKSAVTLPMQKASSNTPETQDSQTSEDSISNTVPIVKPSDEISSENSSKPVQKSRKATAKPPEVDHLTPMQKQTVANYTRAKVYTKAEALAVVEDMAHFLDETYGFDGGMGEASGFVTLTKTVKDRQSRSLFHRKTIEKRKRAIYSAN